MHMRALARTTVVRAQLHDLATVQDELSCFRAWLEADRLSRESNRIVGRESPRARPDPVSMAQGTL